jgi:hypothetical protein
MMKPGGDSVTRSQRLPSSPPDFRAYVPPYHMETFPAAHPSRHERLEMEPPDYHDNSGEGSDGVRLDFGFGLRR